LESRQIRLLLIGYASRRLDFEYPQPTSILKEQLTLQEIEREQRMEIMRLRALVDAALLGTVAARNKDAFDVPYRALESYAELALPYIYKKAKIDESIGIDDKDYWVNFMAERKKALENENTE